MSDRVMRYVGALGLTLVGLALAVVLERELNVPDALIFAATVAISARYLGTGPGLFAAGLSVVAIDLTLFPPIGTLQLTHPEELGYLVVFTLLALVISQATHSLHMARAAAVDLASRTSQLLDVTTALAEAELPSDVARVVMGQGLLVVNATAGSIGVIEHEEFRVIDARPTPPGDAMPVRLGIQRDDPLAAAVRLRRTVWIASRDELRKQFPSAEQLMAEDASQAFMAFPLEHGDMLVGGLMVGFASAASFENDDQTFARLLAQSASNALARACTFERERSGRHEAEVLARTREQVLGVVAHDLRNPLGVAGSVFQMLTEFDVPSEERRKLLESGSRAVQQMGRLISDLLDVMRMESGRLGLDLEDLSVSNVLDLAEEGVKHLAAEKKIALTVEEPDPMLYVKADRGRLGQVLGNLLGNAIKFTPSGGRVSVKARRDGDDVQFEVSDTGPGVSEENQAHLFERFWQGRAADRRGVGLGLAIARAIVEAHGGRIWVISTLGHGSRFFFTIPVGAAMTTSARAS